MTDHTQLAPFDFASLLCSRLCHDLLSPIGALGNGIELLADEHDPAMRAQCMTLLSDSARTSANKLKFFRLAFGSAGGYGEMIPTHEMKDAVDGLFASTGRVTTGWMIENDAVDKLTAKVLLNLAMIIGEALPRGGQLDIGLETLNRTSEIVVRGAGPRIILDPSLRAALDGTLSAEDLSSRTAAAYMINALARANGGGIQISDADPAVLLCGATVLTAR
jgi:histidine phosphotransferase ChpT